MFTTTIALNSITDVKDFVQIVNKYNFKIDLLTSRYTVDAKSLMGIFSLELNKPIQMKIHSKEYQPLISEIEKYISE